MSDDDFKPLDPDETDAPEPEAEHVESPTPPFESSQLSDETPVDPTAGDVTEPTADDPWVSEPVPLPMATAPVVTEEAFPETSSIDSIKILVSCVLAWAIPGLGHVAAGRFGRGLLFAVIVMSLFIGGIALHGKVYRPEPGQPLTYLAAVGAAGVGLPYVAAHSMGLGFGDIRTQSYEYGNTFTLVAGLLNLLIVLDAYDVASGRR